jgi:L-threonylcarbamoyladenylate synthase
VSKIGKDINIAIKILKSGGLVAIPTETVYGLAGNALDPNVVTKIFEAKNRPSFDPLIIHLADVSQWSKYAINIPPLFYTLAEKYCPGPLTFLVEKTKLIPDLVTSGSAYVAVRFPAHALTQHILQDLDFPLAAPSANPFGYISPTTAMHVEAQLGAKVDYIVDGGPCDVGLESTIIGIENGVVNVLRKGGFDAELIRKHTNMEIWYYESSTSNPTAPGMLSSHYAPSVPFYLTDDIDQFRAKNKGQSYGVLCFGRMDRAFDGAKVVLDLSPDQDLKEAAKNLFSYLRILDNSKLEYIVGERVSAYGLGLGINDRLTRASVK